MLYNSLTPHPNTAPKAPNPIQIFLRNIEPPISTHFFTPKPKPTYAPPLVTSLVVFNIESFSTNFTSIPNKFPIFLATFLLII